MRAVLIVSEEDFPMWVVCYALTDMPDVEVCYARDLEDMCVKCRQRLFDLIIILSVKPFLVGDNPVREVRPRQLTHPVVYVLSWVQSEQTVLSLLESGVDQYMTFPISLQRLRLKVLNELNRQV